MQKKQLIFTTLTLSLVFGLRAQSNVFPVSGNVGLGLSSPSAKLHIHTGYSDNSCTTYSGEPALKIRWDIPQLQCIHPYPLGTVPNLVEVQGHPFTGSPQPYWVMSGQGRTGLGVLPQVNYRLAVGGDSYFMGQALVQSHAQIQGKLRVNAGNLTDTDWLAFSFPFSFSVDQGHARFMEKVQIGSQAVGSEQLLVQGDTKMLGRLRIGAEEATGDYSAYHVSVDGDIVSRRIVVQANSWADFVFAPDYQLMPLETLRQFIQEHQHLPGLPSEAELLEQGHIDLAETDKLLLQKIEELTLYILELKAENQNMKQKLQEAGIDID